MGRHTQLLDNHIGDAYVTQIVTLERVLQRWHIAIWRRVIPTDDESFAAALTTALWLEAVDVFEEKFHLRVEKGNFLGPEYLRHKYPSILENHRCYVEGLNVGMSVNARRDIISNLLRIQADFASIRRTSVGQSLNGGG